MTSLEKQRSYQKVGSRPEAQPADTRKRNQFLASADGWTPCKGPAVAIQSIYRSPFTRQVFHYPFLYTFPSFIPFSMSGSPDYL